ncbi:MAG: hypothetical protein KDE27_18465, partial [Planctomycetes bacterium]|nr:hypothetical protein [Planctomycetota bacterium]
MLRSRRGTWERARLSSKSALAIPTRSRMRSYPGRPFAAVLVGSVLAVAARAQEGAHAAAMAAFERGDFARALQGIDEVLARTPRSLDGLYLRAAALAELGRLDESEAVRARIVEVERDLGRDLDERLARARRARLAEAAGNQPVKPSTAPAGASAASRAAELAELPSWIPEQVAQEGEVKAFERVR